jgi:hypothetical protein
MPEIVERAAGLYTIDHPLRVGPVPVGTRTTLVRLGSGALFVHSPGPLGPAGAAEIEALGPVAALVAPNCFHHLFLEENQRAFPGAEVHLAPKLSAKTRGRLKGAVLGDVAPALWADEIESHLVEGGPRVGEVAFLHRASRTLLLCDLVFNIRHCEATLPRWLLRANGMYGHFAPSRAFAHLLFRDRKGLRRSIDRILAWDFDRVIVPHGEIVESGGRSLLEEAFAHLPR